MPRFTPMKPPTLPRVGQAIEKLVLEFKAAPNFSTPYEFAKDIAAFANSLGGTILVGGIEQNGVVAHYKDLARDTCAKARRSYEDAARDWCFVTPTVDFEL